MILYENFFLYIFYLIFNFKTMLNYPTSKPFRCNITNKKVIKIDLPNWKFLIVNKSDYSKLDDEIIKEVIKITSKSSKEYLYISSIEL